MTSAVALTASYIIAVVMGRVNKTHRAGIYGTMASLGATICMSLVTTRYIQHVFAPHHTESPNAAGNRNMKKKQIRLFDNFGFCTLQWPCYIWIDAVMYIRYHFAYVGCWCCAHSMMQQSEAANKFFAARCLARLAVAVVKLQRRFRQRRVKKRQDVFLEELMQRTCHPSRLAQIT